MKRILIACCMLTALACTGGCKKERNNHSCYNPALVHDNPCTADCPGVIGCDGKTYCNECEAARAGISVP